MKLVLIAYNEAIDDEVMEQLDAAGAEGYTKWTEVLGKGRTSGPHLLSHVWPKGNNVLVVVAEDASAKKLLEAIRGLRKTAAKEGVKAFVLNVEEHL
ncbi:MAG: P-II family nitrogen regulator [Planctomycetota bacterium]|nr:P-II family nitrogen regulator [Planctomycetota bacterium]